jgi:hypothetical protein
VRILGLPIRRPDTLQAFRMLCRHNRYVQEFGRVRDQDEVARRERIWDDTLRALELRTGRQAAAIPPDEFQKLLLAELELRGFERRRVKRAERRRDKDKESKV